MNFILSLCLFMVTILFASIGSNSGRYKSQFEFNTATETFGLLTSMRLNGHRDVSLVVDSQQIEEIKEEKEYDKNICDIDFNELAQNETNDPYKQMNEYIASLAPSSQNDYTGIFKGKNLIMICAEAFSDAVISKELTASLYRLSRKGFYFSDYYQLTWGGSTSTGEFSFLFGLVPTNGIQTILDTAANNNYFTVGNQMQRLEYYTKAYHNRNYDFYDRNLTHENLGYNKYLGTGNGLETIAGIEYPNDETMISTTLDTYIDSQPFSIYYMTVSGHSGYYPNTAFVSEHLDKVLEVTGNKYQGVTNYYLCYQMELEEGVYGNTVNYVEDLYGHTIMTQPDQDHNSLIIWSGCLEKGKQYEDLQCEIDTPVYSLDVLPTLSNLFGFKYDSRLLVGRDVFSNQTPFVVWNNYSWLSEKGYYSNSTGEFFANEGIEVDDEYMSKMCQLAQNKVNFSKQIVETNYYGYLFGEDDVIDSTSLWEEKYNSAKKKKAK